MTPKQADRIIKTGKPVTVRSKEYGETMTLVFVSRERWTVDSQDGGRFDRADLEIIKPLEQSS